MMRDGIKMKFSPYLWLRLFGRRIGILGDYGLPLFSERMGLSKTWRFLGYKLVIRKDSLTGSPRFFGGLWRPDVHREVPSDGR